MTEHAAGTAPQPRPARAERWLLLFRGTEGYGVRRFTLDLAEQLRREGAEVRFLAASRGRLAAELQEQGHAGACLELDPAPRFSGSVRRAPHDLYRAGIYSLAAGRRLRRAIREADPDYVVVRENTFFLMVAPALVGGRWQPIWMMPNALSARLRNLRRIFYHVAARLSGTLVLANSHYTASTLGRLLVTPEICHLGVDVGRLRSSAEPADARERYGLSVGQVVFGILARLVPNKGQARVIEAFALLSPSERARAALLVVGGEPDDPYRRDLRALADRLGVHDRIVFVPRRDDVAGLYRLCDVVINARVDPEPFGLSVIEAMALGRPVLAHRAGGPGETVVDDVTGWLLPEATPESMHDGMRRALAREPDLKAMGEQASRHVLENFTVAQVSMRLRRAIENNRLRRPLALRLSRADRYESQESSPLKTSYRMKS